MIRREFITLLGGVAIFPLLAYAQQAGKVHTIGLLSAGPRVVTVIGPFLAALRELGWIEGKNLVIEIRFAEDRIERLPELAAELVRLNVGVIVGFGTLPPLAAKQATTTIPIVMAAAGDPVGSGLVASLARPGGNVTGMSLIGAGPRGQAIRIAQRDSPPARARGCALECLQPVCRTCLQRDAGRWSDFRDRGAVLGGARP